MAEKLPTQARVVVIGAGIVGASVAYHLTKLGFVDLVLLDQKTLASGTTGHGAGLVTQLRHTRSLTDISRQAINLYSNLKKETGHDPGFRQTGSITVARTESRLTELKHMFSMAKSFGVEMNMISPQKASYMWPLMRTEDLVGAVHIPGDGQTVPDSTTMAMVTGARNLGATIVENTKVSDINQISGTVSSITTNRGNIKCEIIVNCAGMWAREIGLLCGVNIPLHAADHAYLVTKPMNGVSVDMPSLRDPDGYIYFRRDIEDQGGLLMGGFEPVANPWGMEGIPDDFASGMLKRDWSPYMVFLEKALERVPSMEDIEILRFLVGPESFTPDNHYILGEAPELKNFFIAAGFNSSGIASAAGAGQAIAEWIVNGQPTMDLTEVDIKRFQPFQNNSKYLYDRTVEGVGVLYDMHWPERQYQSARGARQSALHHLIKSNGACFGSVAGWERPNWYAPANIIPDYEYSYGRQNWFGYAAEEHKAVREDVGLFDQSSFAKFVLKGRDAKDTLQVICSNNVDVDPGTVIYTAMLNSNGGIEADVTVTRISEEEFWIFTGAATSNRTLNWIKNNTPPESNVFLSDITSSYGVIGLMGPKSRALLKHLTGDELSNKQYPFRSSSEFEIGYATVRATRITYVGELGWELQIPSEFMVNVYEAIVSAGEKFNLRHAGYHAMESLRIEKAYKSWGHDITPLETPLEAGLGFAVDFEKPVNFIGRDALMKQLENGLNQRMAVFTMLKSEPYILGNEPIFRDGEIVGHITSGSFGHTIGKSIGLGYIESENITADFVKSGEYELELSTERHPASVSLKPPYDPKNERVRS